MKRTSKCERKLEERYSGAPTGTITLVHDFNIGVPATEFCICDDEADGPIRGSA